MMTGTETMKGTANATMIVKGTGIEQAMQTQIPYSIVYLLRLLMSLNLMFHDVLHMIKMMQWIGRLNDVKEIGSFPGREAEKTKETALLELLTTLEAGIAMIAMTETATSRTIATVVCLQSMIENVRLVLLVRDLPKSEREVVSHAEGALVLGADALLEAALDKKKVTPHHRYSFLQHHWLIAVI